MTMFLKYRGNSRHHLEMLLAISLYSKNRINAMMSDSRNTIRCAILFFDRTPKKMPLSWTVADHRFSQLATAALASLFKLSQTDVGGKPS